MPGSDFLRFVRDLHDWDSSEHDIADASRLSRVGVSRLEMATLTQTIDFAKYLSVSRRRRQILELKTRSQTSYAMKSLPG